MTDEEKILDSLEQVNMKIDDIKQMLEVLEPKDIFEEEAKQAFTNVLNRYISIKNALEKSLRKVENISEEKCLNGKCAADSLW